MNDSLSSGSNDTVAQYSLPFYLDKLSNLIVIIGLGSSAIGLLGNCIVLALIFGSKKFRKPANFYVANLSIISIMYTISLYFRQIYGRRNYWMNQDQSVCSLQAFISRLNHPLIAFTTLTIVIDRNYRVKHPMSVPNKRTLFQIIALIWTVSALVTLPRLYIYGLTTVSKDEVYVGRVQEEQSTGAGELKTGRDLDNGTAMAISMKRCLKTILWNSEAMHIGYLSIYFLIVNIIPITVAIAALIRISRVINLLHACQRWNKDVSNIRHRILRNTFVFAILFILGWGPSGVALYLTDMPSNYMPKIITEHYRFFRYFNIVGYVQNSLNPILLFVLSSDLREYMFKTKRLIFCGGSFKPCKQCKQCKQTSVKSVQ